MNIYNPMQTHSQASLSIFRQSVLANALNLLDIFIVDCRVCSSRVLGISGIIDCCGVVVSALNLRVNRVRFNFVLLWLWITFVVAPTLCRRNIDFHTQKYSNKNDKRSLLLLLLWVENGNADAHTDVNIICIYHQHRIIKTMMRLRELQKPAQNHTQNIMCT